MLHPMLYPINTQKESDGEKRAGGVTLIVFLSCDCLCYLALPHGAVAWSAVCDCGIS